MMRPVRILLAAASLLCAASAPGAEPAAAPSAPDAAAPGGASEGAPAATAAPAAPQAQPLSLRDAVETALEKNLDLQIQRYEPFLAEERLREAWGAYDPNLFGELGYESAQTPTANPLLSGGGASTLVVGSLREKTTDGSTGFSGLLPFSSTGYRVEYGGQRLITTSGIASLSPELRSSLVFSLSQPLLRNFVFNEPWTRVRSSRIASRGEGENFRRELMDVVRDVEASYFQVIAAGEQLRVAEKSLETAKVLLDQTQTQYEVGVVSKVEVTEAEAGVAEREFNLIIARNAYRASQDLLIDRVFGSDLRAGSTLEIDATDRPAFLPRYDVDVEEATRKAFEKRPELAAARLEIDRQQVVLQFAKNQKLPQFDVQGAYGFQGLTGEGKRTIFDPPPPAPEPEGPGRNYFDTHNDFFSGDGALTWSVRGVLSFPLGNRTAGARASQAALELARTRTQEKRLIQNIVLEVREAVRNLRSAQEGTEAAERRRLAAAEQLRAERIRLENGESTPFDVLQRERDLVDAESQKITAERVYRDSVTALDRAQGTILETRNIVVDDVRTLR